MADRNELVRLVKYALLTILVFITASCQTEQISEPQLQLIRYSLKKTDLPSGWKLGGKDWSVDFGGEGYSVLYERGPLVFVGHTIAMYASDAQSQQAYKEWEVKWFDASMNVEPVVSYNPVDRKMTTDLSARRLIQTTRYCSVYIYKDMKKQ